MSDLGFLNVASATVGQKIPFPLNIPQTNPPTIGQMSQNFSDVLVINNLSGCIFQVVLQPSGRSFTLPAGVPTQPIPLSLRGTNDASCTLLVEAILGGIFPNQVHFDWFAATDPVLSVGSAVGVNSNNVSSITISGLDTWIISQDPSGKLYFQNVTDGSIFYMHNGVTVPFFFGEVTGGPGGTSSTQSFLNYSVSGNLLSISTPQVGAANNIEFQTTPAISGGPPLSLGDVNTATGIRINTNGHVISNGVFLPTIAITASGITGASINGTDVRGVITFSTTGSPPAIFTPFLQITYGTSYLVNPVIICASNNEAIQFDPIIGTSTFSIQVPTALAPSATYNFNYIIIG